MLEIEIFTNRIQINSVKKIDYTNILRFYQNDQRYFYATGETEIFDTDSLHEKIMSKTIDNYFFCTSKLINTDEIIGCISGFVDKEKGLLWIYVLVVDVLYQRLGYGTEVFWLVTKHLSGIFLINAVLIAVARENINGQKFWQKQGFSLFKTQDISESHKIYIFHAFV